VQFPFAREPSHVLIALDPELQEAIAKEEEDHRKSEASRLQVIQDRDVQDAARAEEVL
jgi:hypothetical protein